MSFLDAQADHELNRRIGVARGDFNALEKVWKRSALLRARKLHIFATLVGVQAFIRFEQPLSDCGATKAAERLQVQVRPQSDWSGCLLHITCVQ